MSPPATAASRLWGEPYGSLMASALKHRYRHVPYIYTECRRMFEGPVSLCHPLYHRYPESPEAYNFPQQYGFGAGVARGPCHGGNGGRTDWPRLPSGSRKASGSTPPRASGSPGVVIAAATPWRKPPSLPGPAR